MNLIDRFTRDDVSAKVWWPLAMLLVVLFVLTFPAQGRDAANTHDDAGELAVGIVHDVVDPAVARAAASGATASQSTQTLQATIVDDVLDEVPAADVVRLWARDGRLTFSTDPADQIGSGAAVNDRRIQAALADPSRPISLQTDVGLTGEPADASFEVYAALPSAKDVAAQVTFDDEALLQSVSARWWAWRIALGAMGLLTLALAGLSMREPVAPSGAGVKFYPTSVPPGMTVIDSDDAAVLQQSGAHSRRRVQELQARMESLELDKARLEGELQRALSGRAMGAAAVAAIPRPSARPDADLVEIPEPIVADAAPAPATGRTIDPAPSAPEPVVVPATSTDVSEEPTGATPGLDQDVVREPPVAVEQADPPAPRRRRSSPVPARDREAETAPHDDATGAVSVPEPEPAHPGPKPRSEDAWAASSEPVVRVPEAGAPDSDRDVLDVLERLVEPVSTGARSEDAASDMRTRLARTAAAKKPGSRSDERFDHPDHH